MQGKGLTEYCKRDLDFYLLQEPLDRATDAHANDRDIKRMNARRSVGLSLPTTLLRMESEGDESPFLIHRRVSQAYSKLFA